MFVDSVINNGKFKYVNIDRVTQSVTQRKSFPREPRERSRKGLRAMVFLLSVFLECV